MAELDIQTLFSGDTARLVCRGRIVAGGPAEALNSALSELLLQVSAIEMDLDGVTFLDSSGIGVLVRQLVRARAKSKQLRIGKVSPQVRKTLEATNVLAQFRKINTSQLRLRLGTRVLFVHPSADIRTFVSALLKERGATPSTCGSVSEIRDLGGVEQFEMLVIAAELDSSALSTPRLVALPREFFTRQAEVVGDDLIARIAALTRAAGA